MRPSLRNATISLVLGVGIVLGPISQAAQASPVPPFLYSASAYGTYAFVSGTPATVVLGQTAPVNVSGGGCGGALGDSGANTVLTVLAPPLAVTGAVTTTGEATTITGGTRSKATARTAGVSLLGGVVTASVARAVATAKQDGTGFHASSAGTTFTNLVVAGTPITVNPAPNTVIDLLGLGKVTLNQVGKRVTSTASTVTVTAIHVEITVPGNVLGIAVGTHLLVSHASAAIRSTAGNPGRLDGGAYGTRLLLGPLPGVISGITAPIGLPCVGTDGAVRKVSLVSLNVPGVATSGTVQSTAVGTLDPQVVGETTNTVEALNVLSSLITATLVKADAHGSANGTTFSFSDTGSQFVGLSVAGHPEITDSVPANTSVSLLGLGTLWLHRVLTTSERTEVRMIELIVDQSNTYGLPIGTDLRVAVAYVSLHT